MVDLIDDLGNDLPYFGTGLEKKQADHISITIGLDANSIIRKAWWDGVSSVMGQGMCEYICEKVPGLELMEALNKKWPEFDQWKHRSCTSYPILALKRACSEAHQMILNATHEEAATADGSLDSEEDHSPPTE